MRIPCLMALLIIAALAGGSPASAVVEPPAPTRTFAFEAPRTTKGPVALRMVLDFGTAQPCTFRVRTAGVTRRPPILMWEESNAKTAAFFSSYTAQAHTTVAGQTADTRTLVAAGGAWSYDGTAETTFAGVTDYRLVVPDAGAWENANTGYHPPIRIDVSCAEPISITDLAASREAVVFKTDSVGGGTGASVYQPLGGSVNASAGDGLSASFISPTVRLRAGDTTMNSNVAGNLQLTAPSGAYAWALDGSDDIVHEDGPGAYRLTLDRRAAGFSDRLLGVLYGLSPVSSFDEAFGS